MAEVDVFFWHIKPKKMKKIKICGFRRQVGKINVQLEDQYYQNGENAQIRKIYNNFCFLVHILAKIIRNFTAFSIIQFM